jgi:hypothetical protein
MARARKRCTCCGGKAKTRWMCSHCRDDAKWLMDNGHATEGELMAAGLLAPKLPLGRPAEKKTKAAKSLEDNAVWQRLQEMQVAVG